MSSSESIINLKILGPESAAIIKKFFRQCCYSGGSIQAPRFLAKNLNFLRSLLQTINYN